MGIKKILIIRFSSIGDIVLTTPVIRCIKQQLPQVELHFVTKASFKNVLDLNPHINKLHTFEKEITELTQKLSDEKFDIVVDLHKNLRSYRLKRALKTKSYSFDKINLRKFLAVNFKMRSVLPQKHIVERYFETVLPLGVKSDGLGLDYFIPSNEEVAVFSKHFKEVPTKYLALVVGGSYYTKKIPLNKLKEIVERSPLPIILLGGDKDRIIAEELSKTFPSIINFCGSLSLHQSASVLRQAEWVITSDTGLMHIAAAFGKKIISVWGNTIPEFGMSAYKPNSENLMLEVKELTCRPCSKLGHKKCPVGHFKCMNDIDFSFLGGI
jgi:ADP-heptose:LPS heptosyltransferase